MNIYTRTRAQVEKAKSTAAPVTLPTGGVPVAGEKQSEWNRDKIIGTALLVVIYAVSIYFYVERYISLVYR